MTISNYLQEVEKLYFSGAATEHSYRASLQRLLESADNSVTVTNEPKRVKCGAPDYILTKGEIPLGYIEAKDVIPGILDKKETKAQVKKYFNGGLGYNFILTDYLEFRFYREEELVEIVTLAEPNGSSLIVHADQHQHLQNLLQNFCQYHGQTITSSRKLAEMMAAKARMIQTVIFNALQDEEDGGGDLRNQFEAFQNILMHDMEEKQFADMYAQTITYGLFAARLHDPTLQTFSRMEAAELLPRTNPFLRQLFGQIGALNLDTRLQWIVDDLVELFKACNVREILEDYGKVTQRNDPIVHFYEDFLAEYDSALRKSRGVWYTPEPVVDFIVRAVDEVLKTEFGLADGLADTSRTEIEVAGQGTDKRYADNKKRMKLNVHRVQVLDPATGTGTFLARVLQQIYSHFENMPALWKGYVDKDLLPRIHGFEILMASYAMAHLKLDLVLREMGADPQRRFNVFLTNSLEEAHPDTGTLFARWLSEESNQANYIKRDMPIMCVIGNPPYSGESSNKGDWIMSEMEAYKKEPGGKEKLKERNSKWINDDYVKFIRLAESYIEKNGEGILGFITNHSYLDNPTFRGMRWHLLKTFSKIYIIDLHGNAKKKEVAPDGSADSNVFDIQQGVSIIIAIKFSEKSAQKTAQVNYCDLWGSRENKYQFLFDNNLKTINWISLENKSPFFFFVPKDYATEEAYMKGFGPQTLFKMNSVGIVTARDSFTIAHDVNVIQKRIAEFVEVDPEEARSKYSLGKDVRDWKVHLAQEDVKKGNGKLVPISYRPFDTRWTYYTGKSKGFHCMPRGNVMDHLITEDENFNLVIGRQGQVVGSMQWNLIFTTNVITDFNLYYRGGGMVFPLYLYPETTQLSIDQDVERKPNLDPKMVAEIADKLSLRFVPDHEMPEAEEEGTFTPLDLLDYIYAVLHSPNYREKYKEFLKIDFPRIPYPDDQQIFWQLVGLGRQLRGLHLMESPLLGRSSIRLDGGDDLTIDKIGKKSYDPDSQRVYINKDVYFEGVPQLAWDFYIGGYQPAQKWLKDRKGRTLDYNDVKHYMKIITVLIETDRLMKEIDEVREF